MMSCCNPNTTNFALESVTTIPYTGQRPIVSVAYLQTNGSLIFEGIFTQINFTTTDVIIDHGGPASGVVKLLQ